MSILFSRWFIFNVSGEFPYIYIVLYILQVAGFHTITVFVAAVLTKCHGCYILYVCVYQVTCVNDWLVMPMLSKAAQVKLFVVCVFGMLNGGGVVPLLTRAMQVTFH